MYRPGLRLEVAEDLAEYQCSLVMLFCRVHYNLILTVYRINQLGQLSPKSSE
jgi:hypothetical protein